LTKAPLFLNMNQNPMKRRAQKSPGSKKPRAGRSMTREFGRIFLDKEGKWFHQGVEITHERTLEVFSRSVIKAPGRGYLLAIGPERARIKVEDTPYMVRSVELKDGSASVLLNDRTIEPLDPASLKMGKDNVLYCCVKSGQFPARFLRPAYYQIMTCLDQDKKGFFLQIRGRKCYLE